MSDRCSRCGNPNDIFQYCPAGQNGEPCVGAVVEKATAEILCDDAGDNLAVTDLLKRLRTLRVDANSHGELLAILVLPKNREALRRGDPDDLRRCFDLIDTYDAAHRERMKSLDGE